MIFVFFFFQAEDGIRDLVRSRGLGDVYKRQHQDRGGQHPVRHRPVCRRELHGDAAEKQHSQDSRCLLYTSDAADERSRVDLGGRRIIKKKKTQQHIVRDRQRITSIKHWMRESRLEKKEE